jgi:hypothetical protein
MYSTIMVVSFRSGGVRQDIDRTRGTQGYRDEPEPLVDADAAEES